MAELLHPKIQIELDDETPEELTLVQDLMAILKMRQRGLQYFINDTSVYTTITERVDMMSAESTQAVPLRIIRTPVMALPPDSATSFVPSNEYLVLELQFGELEGDPEDGDTNDENYTWHPYILAVLDTASPEEPEILSASTGEPLSSLDMLNVSSIVSEMKKEASTLALADELMYDETGPSYANTDPLVAQPATAAELSEGFYLQRACPYCVTHKQECVHPQAN